MDINCNNMRKNGALPSDNSLFFDIVESLSTTVYICDYETDELLYMNHAAEELSECVFDQTLNKKCYEAITDSKSACSFCPKKLVKLNGSYDTYTISPFNGRTYHTVGRMAKYNGRDTVIYSVSDESTLDTSQQTNAAFYQGLVSNSATAVIAADKKERRVLFANNAWRRQEGIDPDTVVVGEKLDKLIDTDKVFFTQEDIDNLPSDQYTQNHLMSSKGMPINVRSRSITWDGKDAYICYSNDEVEMWSSNNQLQNLIDKIPGGIGICEIKDNVTYLTYLNNAYYGILGVDKETRKKFLGTKALEVVHHDDKPTILNLIEDFKNGTEIAGANYRVKNVNNEWIWIHLDGAVVERKENFLRIYVTFYNCDSMMKTQQELLGNRAMLGAAMQSVKVMAWKYDFNNHRMFMSDTTSESMHWPSVLENVPESIIELGFIHEDSIEDTIELCRGAASGERVSRDICVKSAQNDGFVWERVIYTPVFDENGECVQAIGTSVDITERKERENRYRSQIKSMSEIDDENLIAKGQHNISSNKVIFYSGKQEGAVDLSVNKSYDEAVEMLAQSAFSDSKADEIRKRMSRKKLLNDFAEDSAEGTIEYQRKMPDDRIVWVDMKYSLFLEPESNEIIAFIFSYDITERIIDSLIVRNLSSMEYEGVGLINVKNGQYVLRNILTHLEGPAIVGKGDFYERAALRLPKILIPSEKDTILPLFKLDNIVSRLSQLKVYYFTYSVYDDLKEIRRKKMQFTYLDDTKQTILYCRSDITDMYQKEQQQLHRTEMALAAAENASKAKTEFFSRMSHDMRTPMNGILGLAQLSKDENDVDVLKNNISKIKISGDYLLGLINDTLDFQKIESGKITLEPQIIDCRVLIDSVVGMIRTAAKGKDVNFRVCTKNIDLSWHIRTDPMRIKQIFVNLLSNAVKFTPSGGTVELCIEGKGRDEMTSHIIVTVTDTGIGMSEEFLKNKIFQPFSQESNVIISSYAGTGLGLSIVKKLVELMGGEISVESEKGAGTKFSVKLDVQRVNIDEAQKLKTYHEKQRTNAVQLLKGKNILLAEDHPLNAEIAMRILEKSGCKVKWAENGKIAAEVFEKSGENEYDAILMDIRMPIMDGLTSAEKIRSLSRNDAKKIPIIAMTANAYEEDIKHSIEAGMNDHLAKPIDPKLLYETLAKYITAAEN